MSEIEGITIQNLLDAMLDVDRPMDPRYLYRLSDLDPAEPLPAHCVLFGCAGLGRSGVDAFNHFAGNHIGKLFNSGLFDPAQS